MRWKLRTTINNLEGCFFDILGFYMRLLRAHERSGNHDY
jgi:hypothetical protein